MLAVGLKQYLGFPTSSGGEDLAPVNHVGELHGLQHNEGEFSDKKDNLQSLDEAAEEGEEKQNDESEEKEDEEDSGKANDKQEKDGDSPLTKSPRTVTHLSNIRQRRSIRRGAAESPAAMPSGSGHGTPTGSTRQRRPMRCSRSAEQPVMPTDDLGSSSNQGHGHGDGGGAGEETLTPGRRRQIPRRTRSSDISMIPVRTDHHHGVSPGGRRHPGGLRRTKSSDSSGLPTIATDGHHRAIAMERRRSRMSVTEVSRSQARRSVRGATRGKPVKEEEEVAGANAADGAPATSETKDDLINVDPAEIGELSDSEEEGEEQEQAVDLNLNGKEEQNESNEEEEQNESEEEEEEKKKKCIRDVSIGSIPDISIDDSFLDEADNPSSATPSKSCNRRRRRSAVEEQKQSMLGTPSEHRRRGDTANRAGRRKKSGSSHSPKRSGSSSSSGDREEGQGQPEGRARTRRSCHSRKTQQ